MNLAFHNEPDITLLLVSRRMSITDKTTVPNFLNYILYPHLQDARSLNIRDTSPLPYRCLWRAAGQ
jgi:hypothetical protein